MRSQKTLVVVLAGLLTLDGCASSNSGAVYSRDQVRQEQTVRMGVVQSVRQVLIEGTRTPIGTVAGGAIGGIAGSNVGGGKGAAVGTILGAIGGGLAGSAVEEGVTRKAGLEITVKLDNGQMISITQEADVNFVPGQRVRILAGQGVSRVAP